MTVRVGTAGWSIPREHADAFPEEGSHLERYASVLDAVEINSSFQSYHRPSTYRRWGETVPADFRFSVKCTREVTHERGLRDVGDPVSRFLEGVAELEDRLGALLVQLPPGLEWNSDLAGDFFDDLLQRFAGRIAVEPRHESWFHPNVERFLEARGLARVAADPPRADGVDEPGGTGDWAYYRLHGQPRIYRSAYEPGFLSALAERLRERSSDPERWVIFHNTAEGHGTRNALELQRRLELA